MRYGSLPTLPLLVLLLLVLSGCDSTQEKSERIGRQAQNTDLSGKGVVVTRQTSLVKVGSRRVLRDSNGAAAVVELRNATERPLASLPIAIDVRGRRGSLFRNDQPGLEPSLAGAALLRPGQQLFWVNDQVAVAARPRALRARVGDPRGRAPREPPRIRVSRPTLERDPVSGPNAVGFVSNRSQVEQRKLVLFAVARRGGRVVAAGRGQINRLKPGKRARYHIFFIGDPRGARITVVAPPTRLS